MNDSFKRLYEFVKINFSLILCYTIVSIFFTLMIFNYYQNNKLNKISRGFLSKNYQEFYINNDIDISNFEDIIKEVLPKKGLILKKESFPESIEFNLNRIYFKSGFNYPNLLEGRFLTEEESFSDKNLAVVGKNLLKNIEYKDNKKFILINNIYYEVIGICGEDYESKLDYTIFIPMTIRDNINKFNGTIFVDGIRNVDNFINKVKEKSQNNIILTKVEEAKFIQGSVDPLTGKTTEKVIVMNDLENNSLSIYIYFAIFISALLCIISMSLYWFEKNKKEILVLNILGFYKKEILLRIIKKYFSSATLGSLVGLSISIIILNIL
ncbi:ABC transporter permease [Clostridium tertium]